MRPFVLFGLIASFSSTLDRDKQKIEQLEKNPKIVIKSDIGDIAGYYICKGKEASGKPYSGMAVISKRNEVYTVTWIVGGNSTFTGIGVRQGDVLAISWAMALEKGIIKGVNLYKIESGPRLVGLWATLPGNGIVQRETLVFLKKLESEED